MLLLRGLMPDLTSVTIEGGMFAMAVSFRPYIRKTWKTSRYKLEKREKHHEMSTKWP